MKRMLFWMAIATCALLTTMANAVDSAEPSASGASRPKPSVDELARLKQNPVSGHCLVARKNPSRL